MRFAYLLTIMMVMPILGHSADSPLEQYVKSLKGQSFVLRAHEEIFGPPSYSPFDGRRLQKIGISFYKGEVSIGGVIDWEGRFFVSGNTYRIRDVSIDRKNHNIELKVWGSPLVGPEPEIKLVFLFLKDLTPDTFRQLFFKLFFNPGESDRDYVAANDKNLIDKYIDSYPELFILPLEERKKILLAIRVASPMSGRPLIEKIGNDLYLPADMGGDGVVYNDLQVSQNVRIASSIERLLGRIKVATFGLKGLSKEIAGLKFYWTVLHRDFLNEKNLVHSEKIELLASADSLDQLSSGNLSVLELLQRSILRYDGTKISMTNYEPIGSR